MTAGYVSGCWYFLFSIISDALDCIENVAKGVCTEAAAKHRRDIELLFLQPVADLFLCQFSECKFYLQFSLIV